jgi:carboxyl-terminal processing protease
MLSACQPVEAPASGGGLQASVRGLADIEYVCDVVPKSYVYFETREANWGQACDQAKDSITNASDAGERLLVLETLLDALYDPHVSLNTNSGLSPRLLSSGADYWIEDGEITSVRPGSSAAAAGVAVGDRVLDINGEQMTQAALARVQPEGVKATQVQLDWALNAAGAGYRNIPRRLTVARPGGAVSFELGEPQPQWPGTYVTANRYDDVLHLRLNNSLGDNGAGKAFLAELDANPDAKAFIIDLRDTPGGGNTGNAEPMMGAFFDAPIVYQKIIPSDRDAYNRELKTISAKFVDEPVVVLVGRWTGSMGEGMAVGFDGTGRARVMGARMAGLAGGVEEFKLPESGVTLRMPTYDLAHLDGTPRHDWTPPVLLVADNGDGEDIALASALEWLGAQEAD